MTLLILCDHDRGTLAEASLEALTFETADHHEAVRSFLEKREPKFGSAGG